MLEGDVTHEDMPSSTEGGGIVEGRITASSSIAGWDTEAAGADAQRDQVLIRPSLLHPVPEAGLVLRLEAMLATRGFCCVRP